MILGAHESISGDYSNAILFAIEDGCECLQIFTKNQTQWSDPKPDKEKIENFVKVREKAKLQYVVSHGSYLVNLASNNEDTREKSYQATLKEMERCEALKIDYLVIHPGSHMEQGEEKGLKLISSALNSILKETTNKHTILLLETTAGQGSSIGYKFEHIAFLINSIKTGKTGVCFDTCHCFSAGYDIRNSKTYQETFRLFDSIIGLENLRAFHFNDSKKEFADKKDRHEQIGKGQIGKEAFRLLMKDKRFKNIPAILETPPLESGKRGYRENINFLKSLI